jgi:hypothetical protein
MEDGVMGRRSEPSEAPAPAGVDAEVDAIIKADAMDREAAYRMRGRQYKVLTLSTLGRRWVAAVRASLSDDSPGVGAELGDLTAEVSRRNEAHPWSEVMAEVQKQMVVEGPDSFLPAVQAYHEALKRPKN